MKTLIKSNPETPLFTDVFSPFMNHFFGEGETVKDYFVPKSNIVEHKDAFEIWVSLPGMQKKDIKIDLAEHKLTISGTYLNGELAEESRLLVKELPSGNFSRVFKLGNQIDMDSIEAKFENGLLQITLRKTAQASPKTIAIK